MSREGELGRLSTETEKIVTEWQYAADQKEKHIGRHVMQKWVSECKVCIPDFPATLFFCQHILDCFFVLVLLSLFSPLIKWKKYFFLVCCWLWICAVALNCIFNMQATCEILVCVSQISFCLSEDLPNHLSVSYHISYIISDFHRRIS